MQLKSPQVEEKGAAPQPLQAIYAPVRDELVAVEQTLRDQLDSKSSFVDTLMKHSFRLGGKRMRPALVLLSGKAVGELRGEHPILAALVEMIHTATLIHDDVLDEAQIRRHLDTVNARWSNETSVLLGDYLLARALCLVGSIEDHFAIRTIGEASQAICEGELQQVSNRGNYALSEEDYFEIVSGKTAALTACCCRLGAYFGGGSPDVCEALTRYGRGLGVAFQIADDLLDLLGDEDKVGKSLGTDLAKKKLTLPLIRLLDQVDPHQRERIIAEIGQAENHREFLRPWFERTDAVAYARAKSQAIVRNAVANLETLPESPARDSLERLAAFAISRQH